MFTIDTIEWANGFTSLPQIRRDFPDYKWIAIDEDGGVVIFIKEPEWGDDWDEWIGDGGWFEIAHCLIIEGHAKDTLRRL